MIATPIHYHAMKISACRRIAPLLATLLLSTLASANASAQTSRDRSSAWLDPADYGAHEDRSNPDETTKAWIQCIADAIRLHKSIAFSGDHMVNTDALVIRDQLVIRGNGVRMSRLMTTGPGALLTHDCAMSSSTGRGITLEDFGIVCERATTAQGSVGIRLTNTGAANNAFAFLTHLVVSGFHDGIDVHNQYFYSITQCYVDNYRRYGIRVSNDWTFDAGDGVIRENWIQPLQSTANSGFDAGGANIRIEQNPGMRIVANKIFPGHPAGVSLYGGGTRGEAIPSGMCMILNNQFDSFGANRDAIVIDSDWGKGGASSTVEGARLMNVQIIGNNLSNCARLVDVRALGVQDLTINDNTSFGGGGIRISGAVDAVFIDGNHFDNRAYKSGAGTGFGSAKAIDVTGTATNIRIGTNAFVGFTSE